MWRLSKFSIDGKNNPEVPTIEGYTNGSTWNGWVVVACTRFQILEWLKKTGTEFEIIEPNIKDGGITEYPRLILYWEGYEVVESSPLWLNENFEEVYFLDGWCWVEMEE